MRQFVLLFTLIRSTRSLLTSKVGVVRGLRHYLTAVTYPPLHLVKTTYDFEPNQCVNCKHFVQNTFSGQPFAKCKLFPLSVEPIYDVSSSVVDTSREKHAKIVAPQPMTEPTHIIRDYYYCSTARKRNSMCGEHGRFYEEA
jgi:hypothetical protein